MQKLLRMAAAGLVLVAAACDAPTSTARVEAPSPAQSDLQAVARSVALALQDDAARSAVRDALRDSPWSEHKVVFQEFLATDGGRALLNAAAAASGEGAETLRARVSRLPELDFYVPSPAQRVSWRGTADVAVAATLDLDAATAPGFGADGRTLANAQQARAGVVFMLAPAELRTERLKPQPRGVGQAIQAADESDKTDALYTWVGTDGKEITARYQDLLAGTDKRFKPLTHHSSGDVTYVQQIAGYMTDGGDTYIELGVKADFYAPDGSWVGQARWKKTNIPRNTLVTIGEPLFTSHVLPAGGAAYIRAELWELDNCQNFCSDDNPYGKRDYGPADSDVVKSISCPSGSSVCTFNALTGNLSLHFNPRAASVFSGVRVTADDTFVGQYGYASAQAIDQYGYGIPGYSVSSWSIADPYVATLNTAGSTYADYLGNAAGYTTISATINGVTASDGFTVNSFNEPCDPNRPFEIC